MLEKLLGQFTAFAKLRGTEAESYLRAKSGDTYTYQTTVEGTAQEYELYTDAVIDASQVTTDTLTLDMRPMVTYTLDDYDREVYQSVSSWLSKKMEDAYKQLHRRIEGEFFKEANNQATHVLDDGDFGGTSGNAVTWGVSNVTAIFTESVSEVELNSGNSGYDMAVVATPSQFAKLLQAGFTNNSTVSDRVYLDGFRMPKNAYKGPFYGTDVFYSTFLPHAYIVTYTGLPTADDTLTLAGLEFTAVAAVGATPGNFVIEAGDDDTYGNLATLINGRATTSKGVAFTATAAKRLAVELFATQDLTDGTLTVFKFGSFTAVESLDNATMGDQEVYNYVGEYGVVELAMPMGIKSIVRERPNQPTDNWMTYTLLGTAVPTNNKEKYAMIRSAA